METLLLEDFSRGLDLVSSLNAIEPGFTPNATNFRVNEYGGIEKVLGYSAFADLGAGVDAHELFYFSKSDGSTRRLIAASATKWQHVQSDGTVTDFRTSMTTATETTFVIHDDTLYGLDRANIMASWDGTTLTTHADGVNTGPPKGIILGIWQEKMWVAVGSGMEVRFSDAENFTGTDSWPTASTVTLAGPGTTSNKIVGGMPTPDGLVVFTTSATFLIHDSDTGENTLVDGEHGCKSRKSLALVEDGIYGVNHEGVFKTNGRFPLEIVSRRVDPLFVNETPDVDNAAGVWWFNSYLVSYERGGSYNNLTLDVFPRQGSIMANDYRAEAWAHGHLAGTNERLYFVDAGNTRYVRRAFDGGSFLTVASPGVATDISCYYETPPLNFGVESKIKRLHRLRVVGRGDINVGVKVDYEGTAAGSESLSFPDVSGGVWNTALWGTGEWGGYSLFEGWARLSTRGRRIQLRLFESSGDTFAMRPNLDADAASGELGGCAAYLLEPHFTVSTRRR